MSIGESSDLLNQQEVAVIVRMSEAWLERQRWAKTGIPYVKIGGRVYYERSDIDMWKKRQKVRH